MNHKETGKSKSTRQAILATVDRRHGGRPRVRIGPQYTYREPGLLASGYGGEERRGGEREYLRLIVPAPNCRDQKNGNQGQISTPLNLFFSIRNKPR